MILSKKIRTKNCVKLIEDIAKKSAALCIIAWRELQTTCSQKCESDKEKTVAIQIAGAITKLKTFQVKILPNKHIKSKQCQMTLDNVVAIEFMCLAGAYCPDINFESNQFWESTSMTISSSIKSSFLMKFRLEVKIHWFVIIGHSRLMTKSASINQ